MHVLPVISVVVILAHYPLQLLLLLLLTLRFLVSITDHLLVLLIVGSSNAGFEATVRVSSYTFATRLFWWVPIIGPIVGFLYGLFLSVTGVREAHATTTGKA